MKNIARVLGLVLLLPFVLAVTAKCVAQNTTDFVVLHQDAFALTYSKRQTRVISTQADYEAALALYSIDEPHQLDFNAGQVLLVDMGIRPTGGFSVKVAGVNDGMKGAVRVDVVLTRPGHGCVVAQALTNPFQFVYIPTRYEILIFEKLVTSNCTEVPDGTR